MGQSRTASSSNDDVSGVRLVGLNLTFRSVRKEETMFDNPGLGPESFEFDSEHLTTARTGRWFRRGRDLVVLLDGMRESDPVGRENIFGNEQADSVFSELSDAARPTLRKGSRGSAVNDLQTRLNSEIASGRLPGIRSLVVDGDFGAVTDSAVRAYQRANGLAVDGVVGPQMWDRLLGSQTTSQGQGGGPTQSCNRAEFARLVDECVQQAKKCAIDAHKALAISLAACAAQGFNPACVAAAGAKYWLDLSKCRDALLPVTSPRAGPRDALEKLPADGGSWVQAEKRNRLRNEALA
jgi:hypothetical protein